MMRILHRWPGLVLAGLFVLLLVIAAIQPGWLVSGDPLEASARQAFRAPDSLYWLGSDENGRDILTRLVYAVRPSLVLGLAATAIGLLLGTVFGLTAGLGGHRHETGGVDTLFRDPFAAQHQGLIGPVHGPVVEAARA